MRWRYNGGMSGATFKHQSQAPRVTPVPLFTGMASTSLGGPKENFSKNHPTFTSNEIQGSRDAQIPQPVPGNVAVSNDFNVPHSRFSGEFEVPAEPVSKISPEIKNHPTFTDQTIQIVHPGDYHPGYAEQMLRWFDRPKTKKIYDSYTWKSGAVSEKERFIANTPPHFSEFARSIGVTTRTLRRWARDHTEFGEAYQMCQEILEEFLIDNGLTGSYGAIAMKFVAVNRTRMKDKVVQENVTIDINKVLDGIAAGKVKPGGQLDMPGDDDM